MQFQSPRVLFTQPGRAELQESPSFTGLLNDQEMLIETEFSIISPGTELACLDGKEYWAKLPFVPGYGSVGRVSKVAAGVKKFSVGQRVFTYGQHAKHSPVWPMAISLSDSIDPVHATFSRMAAVSITSIRVSDISLGDCVLVLGLGLVGNLAAQLFGLSGCEVIGVDISPRRREMALACGVRHVLPPGDDLRENIAELTQGEMCHTVVEASGLPSVASTAGNLAGKLGEVILLGSPRIDQQTNITPMLHSIHSWDHHGCITYKGAHEWRFPALKDPDGRDRHSMERNLQCILRLIEENRLHIAPLITHLLSPAHCQEAYDGLRNNKDAYCGVIFDWSKV